MSTRHLARASASFALSAGVALCLASDAAGQAGSASSARQDKPAVSTGKPLTIVGCVAPDRSNADRYTLRDSRTGISYILSGRKVVAYEGRRVRIVGGLYPTANVAGQAGAIDPARAAVAAIESGKSVGTGLSAPVEFTVSTVRPLKGACPPP